MKNRRERLRLPVLYPAILETIKEFVRSKKQTNFEQQGTALGAELPELCLLIGTAGERRLVVEMYCSVGVRQTGATNGSSSLRARDCELLSNRMAGRPNVCQGCEPLSNDGGVRRHKTFVRRHKRYSILLEVPPVSVLAPAVSVYLADLRKQRALANTTDELSYRDFLGKFLRSANDALNRAAEFTGEAKKITFGRPDYEVTNGIRVVGYIEAEALNAPLTALKGHAKEQNERFRLNLHNFLLTNHLEFRLFRDGKEIAKAILPDPPETGAIVIPPSFLGELQTLLETFLDSATPAATSPEQIATQLARRARFLRVAADAMLSHDDSPLHVYWNLYKQTLFEGIEKEKFADVYAQTFTYGLFLAWLNTSGMIFDRDTALHAIPKAVPPIRTLMQFSAFGSLPDEFQWIIDGICSDLESADRDAATKHKTAFDDPLVSFYEPFLAAYDPNLRERAGVYYTPDPVVDFIVRAVDDVLKRDFGKAEGLANSDVRLLDPATGTATFLARAYRQAHETMMQGDDAGLWPDRARNHVAKHFYAFERLPAAYTLAHVKLRQLLAELNAPLADDVRLPVYLADTLTNKAPEQINLPGADVLSREIREAVKVRDQEKILVVMGNPPYFGKSDNPSKDASGKPTFIGKLMQDYYTVDGQPLGERNPKWLQNDYVKFIRFAQYEIERSGQGVVAFITDNSYLDNPTFRGMRRSLMRTFDEIYLLDLHGNSKKKERAPDGGKDENVFDITQGVAIALFIRRPDRHGKSSDATIHHADLYGDRKSKYAALQSSNLQNVDWQELSPNAPFYLFRPQEQTLREEYEQGWKVNDVFTVNTIGIVTGQDTKVFGFSTAEAEELALSANLLTSKIRQIDYRPLDYRESVYDTSLITRPRTEVMHHLIVGENIALVFTRSASPTFPYNHFFTTRHGMLGRYYTDAACITYFAPLWLYPAHGTLETGEERRANLNPAFMQALTERIGETPAPEDVFRYAYAAKPRLETNRESYAPFLIRRLSAPAVTLPKPPTTAQRFTIPTPNPSP